MPSETPNPHSVDRETPAEREAAYADFRSTLAERLIRHDERTHTYVNVRQLADQLLSGEVGYTEAEMSDDYPSGETIPRKVSVLLPDSQTGDFQDGMILYEADLPYGEVRKFELQRNFSPAEKRRSEERSERTESIAVATRSTVQLARAEILADKPEGYEGEPASAVEIRKLLERFPG